MQFLFTHPVVHAVQNVFVAILQKVAACLALLDK